MAETPASQLLLDLVTPSAALASVEVDEVQAPGVEGSFGVRPGHAPLLTGLGSGVLTYTAGGKSEHYAIVGGFCEVADNRVTVLADVAEHASTIDPAQALAELEAAQARLRQAIAKDEQAYRREESSVRSAAARLAASKAG